MMGVATTRGLARWRPRPHRPLSWPRWTDKPSGPLARQPQGAVLLLPRIVTNSLVTRDANPGHFSQLARPLDATTTIS